MKIPVTFHLCTSCYAINNRKSDKHQWDVSGWLPESSVGVCLSIQTAFWNEIPWKIQVVFWLHKRWLAFFFFFSPVYKSTQTSRWRDHETDADSTFLSGVLSSLFIGVCLSLSYQPVMKNLPCRFFCAGICLNPFHNKVCFPLTDLVPTSDTLVCHRRR